MIRDIARMQEKGEQQAEEICDPTWPLPPLTATEAYKDLQKEVCTVVFSALWLRSRREERLRAIPAQSTNFAEDPNCPCFWTTDGRFLPLHMKWTGFAGKRYYSLREPTEV
jgi:hypothetical protein